VGKGDVVEFSDGVPYPVEYKVGSRWDKLSDRVQLCAQGLCLEEMFGVAVPEGALFYKSSQRRQEVLLTPELRSATMTILSAVRLLLRQSQLPPPVADARCPNCSLINICMPEIPAALVALRFRDGGNS
jgi:CRISPR-associated exonuclease Cas4